MKINERKFVKNIGPPGSAAMIRETITQIIHESSSKGKLSTNNLLDYENFLTKNKTILQNDPQRELLLYPNDDISQIVLPRKIRTTIAGIPNKDELTECCLQTKCCCELFESNWNLLHYKYSNYSESHFDLKKKQNNVNLRRDLYETDVDNQMTAANELENRDLSGIYKEGYLMKVTEIGIDRMFANIGSKYFKKRFCVLKQQVDGTYIFVLYKDNRKTDAKITIVMDFCTEIVKNTKKGKLCFELKMSTGHKSYTFTSEADVDFNDWFLKLNTIVQLNRTTDEHKRENSLKHSVNGAATASTTAAGNNNNDYSKTGTLKRLEQSRNPQLMKYALETDNSISNLRKENRSKLFPLIVSYNVSLAKGLKDETAALGPFAEQFGRRIYVKLEELNFRLQSSDEIFDSQIEPYFICLSLFDVCAAKKISENVYFDLNSSKMRSFYENFSGESVDVPDWTPELAKWASFTNEAIFSVTNPHCDIFLVVRIEKILQGSISSSCEPYLKAVKDPKIGSKVHKNVLSYCEKLNKYRMPFAWAAKPLFRLYGNELDTSAEFPVIYRQEQHKLSDDELLKMLAEYRKFEKNSKLTVIPGFIRVKIEIVNSLPANCLTSTLLPLKPFPQPPKKPPTLEVHEFPNNSKCALYPFTVYRNHLYVYPQTISIAEGSKFFFRNRSIVCYIELRDSDTEQTTPLRCIYGRPGSDTLINRYCSYVVHHDYNPNWYEEVKIRLPIKITAMHHLLFSFYHVCCDISKKREHQIEELIGYCWIPLLKKNKLCFEQQTVPLATNLPGGYLAVQSLGLGMGVSISIVSGNCKSTKLIKSDVKFSGPEVNWLENQKPIFTVDFHFQSTINSQDPHLQNLFNHAEHLLAKKPFSLPNELETCKILKALHAIHLDTLINFFPVIFNLLFRLLVHIDNEEIDTNILKLMINLVHMISEAGHKNLLKTYAKYVFVVPESISIKPKTIHDDFVKFLPNILHPTNTDFLVINKFLSQSQFFLAILNKSMVQFLLTSLRIKMQRNERFSKDFHTKLESLIGTIIYYIFNKFSDMQKEVKEINKNFAYFLKNCLSIMDRGFVFKMINLYIDKCSLGDPKLLQGFKFEFLQIVCNHEHYVAINLPIKQSQLSNKHKSIELGYNCSLSESFRQYHYLASVLLAELKNALHETSIVRSLALSILKDLLIKHEFDDRYQNKGQLSRIVSLYLPWLEIVVDNLYRFESERDCSDRDSLDTNFGAKVTVAASIATSSSETSKDKRIVSYLDPKTPFHVRNSAFFEAIAGHHGIELNSSTSTFSLNSDHCDKESLISQETAIECDQTPIIAKENVSSKSNSVNSRPLSNSVFRLPKSYDKFLINETKDILQCFVFIVKYVTDDQMLMWWQHFNEHYVIGFFSILRLTLSIFKYKGKKEVIKKSGDNDDDDDDNGSSEKSSKANTLPARIQPIDFSGDTSRNDIQHAVSNNECLYSDTDFPESDGLVEANLAAEISLVTLDCLGLYLTHFQNSLLVNNGDNCLMDTIIDTLIAFMRIGQSEYVYTHFFAILRSFINKYSSVLFQGKASNCAKLCYELLRCCNNRLQSIRQEACAVLYLLMRANYEFTFQQGFNRIQLQMVISISQMLGKASMASTLNNSRFQDSLSVINSYASSDKGMTRTKFPLEVKDLTKRIRTVLMATSQMKEHYGDPEMLVDLKYSLAKSYMCTPELRHTWLETMTRYHVKEHNFSEALLCQLHIAALIAEYLHSRKLLEWDARAFAKISANIARDECNVSLDGGGLSEDRYSLEVLREQLEKCIDFIDKSERYELAGEIFRFLIPIYEQNKHYESLVKSYESLAYFYKRIVDVKKSRKRFLGRYFRVGFYNEYFFDNQHRLEYIYKEPKVTSLSEIAERLKLQYSNKFGPEAVQIIMESVPIESVAVDRKIAYIQITHVTPYSENDKDGARKCEFDNNHDICEFVFETPFTKDGRTHGSPEGQWRRRTILKTEYTFPYVKKRILIIDRKDIEMCPIEVAIDEMRTRVAELEDVVVEPIDAKKLQLKLQGSICVQVNAGPLAYASVFLDRALSKMYPQKYLNALRNEYKNFVKVSQVALELNNNLITAEQKAYQEVLYENFYKLCSSLNDLFDLNLDSFETHEFSITNGN